MRSGNTLWRIVLLALLFYSGFSLISVRIDLNRTRHTADNLQEQYVLLRAENELLNELLSQGVDDMQLQDLARERLGLVLPGEKVFYFTKDRED